MAAQQAAAAAGEFHRLQAEQAAARESAADAAATTLGPGPPGPQAPLASPAPVDSSSAPDLFTAQCATQAAFECIVAVSQEQSFDMDNPTHQHQLSDLLGKRLTAISQAAEKNSRQKVSHGEEPDRDMS